MKLATALIALVLTLTVAAHSLAAAVVEYPVDLFGRKTANGVWSNLAFGIGWNIVSEGPVEWRSYIAFDLNGLQQHVVSAEIHTVGGTVPTIDPTETVGLYDVTSTFNQLRYDATPEVFDDLGTGTFYGSSSDYRRNVALSAPVLFTLNAAAIDDINAKRGDFFAVGLKLETARFPRVYEFINGVNLPRPFLRLTVVPEPSSCLIAFVLGTTLMLRCRP